MPRAVPTVENEQTPLFRMRMSDRFEASPYHRTQYEPASEGVYSQFISVKFAFWTLIAL